MTPVPHILRSSPLYFVGEAPGETEAREGKPFVGASGRLLRQMCTIAEIDLDECSVGNVFLNRPAGNQVEDFLTKDKTNAIPGYPALRQAQYVRAEFQHDLDILQSNLADARPNLIVALGATACWALLRQTGITKLRGFIHASPLGKVLPIYHPASIFRQFQWWAPTVLDLKKAKVQSTFPEVRRPRRTIYVPESPADLQSFWNAHASRSVSVDVETAQKQITCLGISPSDDHALVIPFVRQDATRYWPDHASECEAWRFISRIIGDPTITKTFHNSPYDLTYITSPQGMGIPFRGPLADTMVMHHALWPEVRKALAYLGSIYTDEPAWKLARLRNRDHKKEDD